MPNISNHVFRHLKNEVATKPESGRLASEAVWSFLCYVFSNFIALMMNDLHVSSYMTKKGSGDVKYFLSKKWQKLAP